MSLLGAAVPHSVSVALPFLRPASSFFSHFGTRPYTTHALGGIFALCTRAGVRGGAVPQGRGSRLAGPGRAEAAARAALGPPEDGAGGVGFGLRTCGGSTSPAAPTAEGGRCACVAVGRRLLRWCSRLARRGRFHIARPTAPDWVLAVCGLIGAFGGARDRAGPGGGPTWLAPQRAYGRAK